MRQRFLIFALAALLAGCPATTDKKKDADKPAQTEKPLRLNAADELTFQAFASRLRQAVAQRDIPVIASMMSPSFGYRWDTPPEGENVFAYWNEHNVWPELELVLRERFITKGGFRVAPPQFASDPDNYHGYRAGIQIVEGAWRFAYFVPDEP
jgi:hypothetical protein